MSLISYGQTDIGQVRKTNQDSIYVNKEKRIFIVADGMGGHQGGDIASALAVKHAPEYLLKNLSNDPEENIINSFNYANSTIKQKADENPKLKGMGTTIVGLVFVGGTVYIGNVGDSRAHLVNKNQLYQLSKDHSLVQEKINLGIYTREDGAKDPQKNVLYRTVGFENKISVDVFSYKVLRNDIFLICSDGLHSKVSNRDIVYLINQNIPNPGQATEDDVTKAVKALIAQANQNGGQDNISVILVIAK